VNGSNENQENGVANTMKKSITERKERTQVVQELTGTILDEAAHDTTLTAALKVKHITAVADVAKRQEDRVKTMQKATEERLRSMECVMANMQSDLTDLKDHLQMISRVHSADMEHQNQQPYRETIPLDNSCSDEQPAEIPPHRMVNAVQPGPVTNPIIFAAQPAVTTNPMVDAVQPAALTDPMIDAVQPAAMTNSICSSIHLHLHQEQYLV